MKLMQFEIQTGDYHDTWVYDRNDCSYTGHLKEAGLTDPYRIVSFPHPASRKQKLRFLVSYALGRNKIASLSFAATDERLGAFLKSL